jgi:G6PDH family F420-dependent oxidoreductase
MLQLGYALSSEEHAPQKLIDDAVAAEQAGFSYALISDHYFPWLDTQGQSPFVWTVIGGISQQTKTLQLGTGVTCPILRYHPALIAQAAATVGSLMEGRFFLGLGTGENLNEHIVGQGWPPINQRQEMLAEAIEIIRMLWEGGLKSYEGNYFRVEEARIYTLPDQLPPIYVAASGEHSATLAGQMGDGFITTSPEQELVQTFQKAGGGNKPIYGQLTVCVAKTEQQGVETAFKWWANTAVPGQLSQELKLPSFFQQATTLVTPEHIKKAVVCGSDPKQHLEKIKAFAKAGFDNVYIHQVGPDQEAFFRFYEEEILPEISSIEVVKAEEASPHTRTVSVSL